MPRKAAVKYRSLRTNLVHLPLSLFASLAQQQARPQGLILHLAPLVATSSASYSARPPQAAYLGWSGLAAASSLTGIGSGAETVEVDPEVALGLGWTEGTLVEISIIHNPVRARSVSVTPITADDWEILEQHASYLEDNLLGQLRAAQIGREVDVWVKGRSKIRIRIDATEPPSTGDSAVLLNLDTEVYVAPRPRQSESSKTQKSPAPIPQSLPTSSGNKKGKGRDSDRGVELRIIPLGVAATWGQPGDTGKGKEAVGWCSTDTADVTRKALGAKEGKALVVRVTRRTETGDAPPAEAGGGTGAAGETEAPGVVVHLKVWDEVPDGHVVLQAEEGSKSSAGWGVGAVTLVSGPSGRVLGKLQKWPIPPVLPPLAGTQNIADRCLDYLLLSHTSDSPRPLLLTGAKGCGKSTIARWAASTLETARDAMYETLVIDVARLDGDGRVAKVKEEMSAWRADAEKRAPCLLVLDGLDLLLAPENELNSSSNPVILADHFCRLMTDMPSGVLVLVTATAAANLHPLLGAKHVFGETIKVPPADKNIRQEILRSVVASDTTHLKSQSRTADRVLDFVTIAGMTEGYTAADIKDLVAGAVQQAVIRSSMGEEAALQLPDFVEAQAAFTPLNLRGVALQKSDVQWSDIGGLTETRRVLRETLEWPTKYAQIFARCPLRLRSGLLLYGFPGCGKTLLASAVARECGLNFISVKGPEILNKYIGASEKSVRDLFERASGARPCVLFFDEFEAVAPKRGHDSTGVTDRVVNQMLTEMDGAQGLEGVYVLAATSRPDLIDPALLRPGRLDKALLCGMPDKRDRLEILVALARKLPLHPSVDIEQIADDTEGFSGADLQAMMYNAHLEVVQAQIAPRVEDVAVGGGGVKGKGKMAVDGEKAEGKSKGKGKGKMDGDEQMVEEAREVVSENSVRMWPEMQGSRADRAAIETRIDTIVSSYSVAGQAEKSKVVAASARGAHVIELRHLLKSLDNTRPSVSSSDLARLRKVYSAFASDRDGKMGDGEGGRDTGTRASLM